ncbi:transcriptional regulator NrdR [Cyanobacterium sp. uoEpiScrs1]|uniref:transcriptional regulator NrdR n=1 Tax=Cyanobacterium sp. uoEpiScrs1 TaxID=2976343 RepID=UPI00226A4905|nr:transcriptional regulator NrdR [Cyanobacterium sp. uoEpiScrs1]
MQCPYCQHINSRVLESRSSEGGQSIRRRRECLSCKHRFTTYERVEFVPIIVIKHDEKKESFDHSKLLRGMVRACEKTGITHQRLESIVDEIEAQLQQRPQREVTSQEIGQLVLDYLRQESEVAYIRFASVYGRFQGINDFVATLKQFREKPSSPETLWLKNNHNTPEHNTYDEGTSSSIMTSS